jgi:hypothetical protein
LRVDREFFDKRIVWRGGWGKFLQGFISGHVVRGESLLAWLVEFVYGFSLLEYFVSSLGLLVGDIDKILVNFFSLLQELEEKLVCYYAKL